MLCEKIDVNINLGLSVIGVLLLISIMNLMANVFNLVLFILLLKSIIMLVLFNCSKIVFILLV